MSHGGGVYVQWGWRIHPNVQKWRISPKGRNSYFWCKNLLFLYSCASLKMPIQSMTLFNNNESIFFIIKTLITLTKINNWHSFVVRDT